MRSAEICESWRQRRQARSLVLAGSAAFIIWLLVSKLSAAPTFESRTLTNGLTVAVVHFPNSTNASLFTFLPLGLTADGAHQAQWSHLVEHLVIRSTLPDDLTQGNAETGPDNMRLDFYGHSGNWSEGLTHHRRWLEGVPFTETSLIAEKPRVVSECDYTAQNFFTHKFALAAWAQAVRHGQTRVAMKGDVLAAKLPDIQRYRDGHLFQGNQTMLCLVGGVEPKLFFAEAEKQFSSLKSAATPKIASAPIPTRGTNFSVTWDLDARHLILSWPIPNPGSENYAALLLASRQLLMQLFSDAELKTKTGQVLAGVDLTMPEGTYFYISASLRPGAEFSEAQKSLRGLVANLGVADAAILPMLEQQFAYSFIQIPDPAAMMAQPLGAR